MRVVGISGSPSPASKTASLVDFVLSQLGTGPSLAHLHLGTLDSAALTRGIPEEESVRRAIVAVENADALIIASPIYKASFSGLLKTFLDLLPQYALAGKVVLPLATGGSAAHMLAIDYALRPVLQSMGARHIIQSVFVRASDILQDEGKLRIAPDSALHLEEALLHFRHTLDHPADVLMLGHPRPLRAAKPAAPPRIAELPFIVPF